jgi:hypothetical protein
MSEFKNNAFRVSGDRVTFGDNSGNTTVSNVRVTNNIRSGGGPGPEPTDSVAVLFASFAGVVLLAWVYLKHFDAVHAALRLGFLFSTAPVLLASAISASRTNGSTSKLFASGLPVGLIGVIGLVFIGFLNDRISSGVLALAAQTSPMVMWKSLSDFGRRVVLEGEGAVIAAGMALLVNWLVALRILINHTLSPFNFLSRMTLRYTPMFGATFSATFLALSWGLSSGRAYDAWAAMQVALSTAMH